MKTNYQLNDEDKMKHLRNLFDYRVWGIMDLMHRIYSLV